ncbi:MAG TPA: alpha-ribazole phosphatase [Clostridia bacterium]
MKLFFIRHGQTDWNVKGRMQGSFDSELNNTGINQAEELAKKLLESNYKFSKIYSSTLKRAVKTAQILCKALNLEHIQLKGLEEINLGQWEGLTWEEVKEKFPEEYAKWYENRRYTRSPGGESYQDMLDRVLEAINKIINGNDRNVAIVTHGGVIMCLQCYITNTPYNEMRKFKVDNTSILELDSKLFDITTQ